MLFSGSLSVRKREAEIKRFLEDPQTRVFFSTGAGGVGLNLQSAANIVVNLEMPWNPAVLEQRIGRVYRMGQKKSVQAINLMSAECAEQKIFELVGQKKALFTGVFDGKTQEIRFDPKQTASFLDKVQKIVPVEEGNVSAAADTVSKSAPPPTSPPPITLPNAGLKISQDENGLHVSIPPAAMEALKGLRPLLETLLKLSS